MAEDGNKEEKEYPIPLRGSVMAGATLERLQKKGILPVRDEEPTAELKPSPPKEEYNPMKKAFPQDPKKQTRIVDSYRQPDTEETVPPKDKKELTEEARRLNIIAMGTGGASGENKDLPHVPPFTENSTGQQVPGSETPPPPPPIEHVEARGGAEPLKRIIRAQEVVEKVKSGENVPPSQTEAVPEHEVVIPSHDVAPEAAPWIKKEQPRMVAGTVKTAVTQTASEAPIKPPSPTPERVAYNQSVARGQELKKRWYDKLPFLSILRGEKKPAG